MIPDTPKHLYFGGGADTLITPPGLCILLLASVGILLLPRKYVVVPFLLGSLLITVRQEVVLVGLHLMVYRLLILFGWVRILWNVVLVGDRPFADRINPLDKTLILWALSNTVTFTILWHESGAVINRLGFLYTTLGAYFLLRYAVRDREDVIRTIKVLGAISLIIAIFMAVEHWSGRNAFSIFGGVRLVSEVRLGRIRAQGPFLHSIVAGTFGAMLLPLFVGLWSQGKGHRVAALVGVLSSTAMTITSASSTPVCVFVAGIAGLCFWPFRKHMQMIRWCIVTLTVGLHLVMKGPVWALVARFEAVGGSSGYHRYELINQFIRHFEEWWLVGTRNNAYWGYDMWDCINAYVRAGVEGGLITFVLFISIFLFAYKIIGVSRRLAENDRTQELLIWALGACVFANTVGFFGEMYYDQSVLGWYAVLAMIPAAGIALPSESHDQPYADPSLATVELALFRPGSYDEPQRI